MIGEIWRQILSKLTRRWTFPQQYKRIKTWKRMNGTHFKRQLCLPQKRETKSRLRRWSLESKRLSMRTTTGAILSQVTSKRSSLLLQLASTHRLNTWDPLLRRSAVRNVIPCLLVAQGYLMVWLRLLRSLTVVAHLNASNVTKKYRGSSMRPGRSPLTTSLWETIIRIFNNFRPVSTLKQVAQLTLVSVNSSRSRAKRPLARVMKMTYVNKTDGYAEDTDMVFSIEIMI